MFISHPPNKPKLSHVYSDSSSGELDLPSLAVLKCESSIQKEVDRRLVEIECQSKVTGNDTAKITA